MARSPKPPVSANSAISRIASSESLPLQSPELTRMPYSVNASRHRDRLVFDLGVALGRRLFVRDALDDAADGQRVLLRELEVALVVRGHAHHGARAVLGQDVVAGPHRNQLAAERVDGQQAGVDALLLLRRAGLARRGPLGAHALGEAAHVLLHRRVLDQRMVGRDDDGVRAVDGVDARGEDADALVRVFNLKVDVGAGAFADPVALHRQDALGPAPLDLAHVFQQLLGVVGDAQEPLLDVALLDGRAAAPADAARRLLVREHGRFGRAPVDRRDLLVGQAPLQHLQEEPLIPLVILGRVRGDLAPPVEAEAHALELPAHVLDVLLRPVAGHHAALDGGLLGGLAEAVPAHRVQDVVALQAPEPRQRVADGVVAHMPHVQEARRVGEHLQTVETLLAFGVALDLEGTRLLPELLPPLLDPLGEILFVHDSPLAFPLPLKVNDRPRLSQARGASTY